VSVVSAYPGVRRALVAQQRRISASGKIVMVGRDIGTIVLPNADLKVFLDADINARARRRYQELMERGEKFSYDDVLTAMQRRDEIDSARKVSPLLPACDAIIIDTSELTIGQVLDQIETLIQETVN
jgi:cytidylate kinase